MRIMRTTIFIAIMSAVCCLQASGVLAGGHSGIWKPSDGSNNFYIQTYSTGSILIISTQDGQDYYVFLDPDVTDGISATEYFGKNASMTLSFVDESTAMLQLTINSKTTAYTISKRFDGDCRTVSGLKCNVPFCRQVTHYEVGDGVEGVDELEVACITGPEGGTVFDSKDGEYIVTGTYRLGTHSTATVSLKWGGSTTYSAYEEYDIQAPGEGTFQVRVVKVSGGEGNLFLRMDGPSGPMLDVVPVNTNCPSSLFLQEKSAPGSGKAGALREEWIGTPYGASGGLNGTGNGSIE